MADIDKSTPIPVSAPGIKALPVDPGTPVIEISLWRVRARLIWRGLKTNLALFTENPIGLIGVGIILLFALIALVHPVLMGSVWDPNVYDPVVGIDQAISPHPAAPSAGHLLGTDPLGRDVLSQLMWSTRSAFVLGLVAATVTVVIATTVGALSAYFGGAIDSVFMRLADLIIMTPTVTILIVLGTLLDLGMIQLAVVIGILSGFGAATVIIKSQALTIKVRTYIEAARVAGGSNWHIISKHIIPNLMPLSFLYMMFTVTSAIAIEAVLSFFGLLNIRMSWGLMIQTTSFAGYLLDFKKWWLVFPPSIAISSLSAAFYLVGRALDEVVNPRLRKR